MDRNTVEKSVKMKKVNGNLNLKVSMPNTDRSIVSCPKTQNHLRVNKTTSRNKINSGNSYSQVQHYRLKNPKNVILGHLNVNSLKNKIEAVKKLIRNNIEISLFSETKLDEVFPNQQFKISGYKCSEEIETNMAGVLSFTSMKIFLAKQLMLKSSPMTMKSF